MKVDYKDKKERPYFLLKEKPELRQTTQVYALGFPAAVSKSLSLGTEGKEDTRKLSEQVESSLGEADFRYSITGGIINLIRSDRGIEYIIHGAQISGGNSGGPLIDKDGTVLGINTLKGVDKDGDIGSVTNYYALSFPQMIREIKKQVPSIFD